MCLSSERVPFLCALPDDGPDHCHGGAPECNPASSWLVCVLVPHHVLLWPTDAMGGHCDLYLHMYVCFWWAACIWVVVALSWWGEQCSLESLPPWHLAYSVG